MGMRFACILALALMYGCGEDSATATCQPDACSDTGMNSTPLTDSGMPDNGNAADLLPDQGVGQIELDLEVFRFDYVAVGDSGEQTVAIRNTGSADIELTTFAPAFGNDYTLYWHLGSAAVPLNEQEVGVLNGHNMMPEVTTLPVGASLRLTLVYRPTEAGTRGGQLVFQGGREVRIPIEHSDDRPIFTPDQAEVVIEDVPLGERRLAILSVMNEGTAIATLSAIQLTGDEEFSVRIEGRDPEMDTRALHNPDRDLEPGVGIGKTFEILIRFRSDVAGEFRAEIRIVSDAVNDDIVVPVVARTQAK